MKTLIFFLAGVVLCGCSKEPTEKTTPPPPQATSPAPSSTPVSAADPAPVSAFVPVAEYTNSIANELAIQIKAAQKGFEYGRAQAMQLEQQAHFNSDVGSELGSYSLEELTNEITSNFWQLQTNPIIIKK